MQIKIENSRCISVILSKKEIEEKFDFIIQSEDDVKKFLDESMKKIFSEVIQKTNGKPKNEIYTNVYYSEGGIMLRFHGIEAEGVEDSTNEDTENDTENQAEEKEDTVFSTAVFQFQNIYQMVKFVQGTACAEDNETMDGEIFRIDGRYILILYGHINIVKVAHYKRYCNEISPFSQNPMQQTLYIREHGELLMGKKDKPLEKLKII